MSQNNEDEDLRLTVRGVRKYVVGFQVRYTASLVLGAEDCETLGRLAAFSHAKDRPDRAQARSYMIIEILLFDISYLLVLAAVASKTLTTRVEKSRTPMPGYCVCHSSLHTLISTQTKADHLLQSSSAVFAHFLISTYCLVLLAAAERICCPGEPLCQPLPHDDEDLLRNGRLRVWPMEDDDAVRGAKVHCATTSLRD